MVVSLDGFVVFILGFIIILFIRVVRDLFWIGRVERIVFVVFWGFFIVDKGMIWDDIKIWFFMGFVFVLGLMIVLIVLC